MDEERGCKNGCFLQPLSFRESKKRCRTDKPSKNKTFGLFLVPRRRTMVRRAARLVRSIKRKIDSYCCFLDCLKGSYRHISCEEPFDLYCSMGSALFLHSLFYSSICRPKKSAATCVNFTSASSGTAPVSEAIIQTAPTTSPAAKMGAATPAFRSNPSKGQKRR